MRRSQLTVGQVVLFTCSPEERHSFGYGVGKIVSMYADDCLIDTGEPERLYHVEYEDVMLVLESE